MLRCRVEAEARQQRAGRYRNWNPPLLGNLPDDFLRIFPQQLDGIKVSRRPRRLTFDLGNGSPQPSGFLRQGSQSSLSQPSSSSSSSSASSVSQRTSRSGSQAGAAGTAGAQGLAPGATERDKKLKQYLEDERIALFLQNEEFMRELQRNREFLMALERGTAVLGGGGGRKGLLEQQHVWMDPELQQLLCGPVSIRLEPSK